MFHGGSGGGGGATCMSLPLGKYIRRALRGSGGRGKPRLKDKEYARQRSSASSVSVELMAASSSAASASASWTTSAAASWSSSASATSSSVVRVVLWSGMVEVYAGVVLACTVIRRHPPGLCLAHTDVFRNPHRATLRPLEPLFPGQKFFLLPETTVRKLQRDIPLDVRSLPAVPFPQASVGDDGEDEEEETSTEMSSPSRSRSWSEEERKPEGAAGAAPEGCCAVDFYKNRERWAELQFQMMVEGGLAADENQSSSSSSSSRPSTGDRRNDRRIDRRRRPKKQKRDLLSSGAAPPASMSRSWEPSLPPVLEEASPSSPEPQSTSWEARTTDYETH